MTSRELPVRRRPVFLTGMMGSGKTTVGRRLAEARRATFVDLDLRIERVFGRSIAQLFERGPSVFRRCERRALASLLAEPAFAASGVVVATGGGAVIDPDNRRLMAAVGDVVYLRVPVDVLVERLHAPRDRGSRPLLADAEQLAERLRELSGEREAAYASAEHVIDAVGTPAEVVDRVVSRLDRDGGTHDPR